MKFIYELMWQEMGNRKHIYIYIHTGFLEKKCKTMINTACINFFSKFWFQDFCQNDLQLLDPIFFKKYFILLYKLKSHKLSCNYMQIILSSNIKIIEGNQNNFFFGYTPTKKNPHKAHASWKCKQINILIHLVLSPNC